MMLVPTFVDKSEIDGVGLFTAEDIPAGTRIWQWDPDFDITLTYDQMETFPKWKQQYFEHYCFEQDGILFYCADNNRFVNHSDTPNAYDDGDMYICQSGYQERCGNYYRL